MGKVGAPPQSRSVLSANPNDTPISGTRDEDPLAKVAGADPCSSIRAWSGRRAVAAALDKGTIPGGGRFPPLGWVTAGAPDGLPLSSLDNVSRPASVQPVDSG